MENNIGDLKDSIKKVRLRKATQSWHKYLEGKTLLVGETVINYNLISISNEENWIENLCKYVYENDKKLFDELGYGSLNAYIEECKLGNDGFGFSKDEIEIVEG